MTLYDELRRAAGGIGDEEFAPLPSFGPELSSIGPLNPTLPDAVTSLQRKYSRDLPLMRAAGIPDPIIQSMLRFETKRAQRGQSPMSSEKTAQLLKAARDKKAQTQAPERDPGDFLGNIAGDISDIVTFIPKLPEMLVKEVADMPNLIQRIQEGGGGIEGILSAPGIRLLPGAYTAKNIVSGDIDEIISHPVMSFLDVALPGKVLGVGARLGKIPVGGAGTVAEVAARTKAALAMTTGGRVARQTWGLDTRAMAKTLAESAVDLVRAAHPGLRKFFDDEVSLIRQDGSVATAALDDAVKQRVGKGRDTQAARHAEIFEAAESGLLRDLDMTDLERAAVEDVLSVRDRLRQVSLDAGDLHERLVGTAARETETFSTPQARRIDAQRAALTRKETFTNVRESIRAGTTDLPTLFAQVQAALLDTSAPLSRHRNLVRGYVHALEANGYEVGALTPTLSDMSKATAAGFIDGLDPASLPRPRPFSPPTQTAVEWMNTNKTFTPKSLETLRARVAKAEAKIVPARWQPTVMRAKQSAVRDAVTTRLAPDDPSLPGVLELVNERNYGMLRDRGLISADDLKLWEAEAIATIDDLRAAGISPEFIHHVSPAAANALSKPRLTSMVPRPSQIADRINDWTPHAQSLSVAISHQGLELARESLARQTVAKIGEAFTTTAAQVRESLAPVARRSAARRGGDVGAEIERLMGKEYVRWSETENGFVAASAKPVKFSELQRIDGEELLIPRHLADSLMQISKPAPISKLFDPVLNLFRYSVLPFSPRFQINNVGGGAIMAALENPRVLTQLGKAWKVARQNRKLTKTLADDTLHGEPLAVLESMSRSMRSSLGTLEYSATPESIGRIRPDKLVQFKAGQQAGKWFGQVANALKRGADWSFGINQFMDDVYRVASYLEGQRGALKKGASAKDAARAGEALVNKIQPRWLEMTPMERSILRPLAPFYSFLSHTFRYAHRYPIDHPWRTSVMAAFARTELEDQATGLPQMFASMFGLGQGTDGKETFIDIGAMNPFRQLGTDMTLAGFVSELNPAFKVALGQLGYDTAARGPDLYPDVEYDPKTGRFKSKAQSTSNLLGDLIGGFVPQANILSALIGMNGTYNEMLQSNPSAAHRMLLSSAGIPLLWRTVDTNEEMFKAEMNRQTSQDSALSRALRSGDYSDAQRYPSLAPYLEQLRLYAGTGNITPFQNPELEAAQQSIVANVGG